MTPQDQQQQQMPIQAVPTRETVREEYKVHLFLSYLGHIFLGVPLSLIPLLTVKDDEFIKWQAKQALVLYLVVLAIELISIPLMFVVIGFCTAAVAGVGGVILSVMALVKSLNGERWRIPLVADLADKF